MTETSSKWKLIEKQTGTLVGIIDHKTQRFEPAPLFKKYRALFEHHYNVLSKEGITSKGEDEWADLDEEIQDRLKVLNPQGKPPGMWTLWINTEDDFLCNLMWLDETPEELDRNSPPLSLKTRMKVKLYTIRRHARRKLAKRPPLVKD